LTKEEKNRMIDEAFKDLMLAYSQSNHKVKAELVTRVFEFARKAHDGVKRRSGLPFILHPIAVAKICVSEIGLGSTSICSALLHDVVEDTDYTLDDIKQLFGEIIANIVDGLTKISGGRIFADSASKQAENFHKLILTIPSDVRVIMIKMADRLHNMRTLDAMSPLKQQKITGETIFIYAPLAQRLGFFKIKTELENLCLKYQQPQLYDELQKKIDCLTPQLEADYERFIEPIKKSLEQKKFQFRISKRIKTPYSVYKKQITKNLKFEEIFDLLAVRIVVEPRENETESDACWSVFGSITTFYDEHPNRTRNWIKEPKANGYQSLHLTAMLRGNKSEEGKWIEVQIRTEKMDEIAERGVAAHWKYKTGIDDPSNFDEWFQSIKDLLTSEIVDTVELVDKFKMNLDTKEIYVFTPRGDIKKLPVNSTVLDFAFFLHSELGMHCIGAQLDHKLVPISHILHSGDQIEILTSKTQFPQPSWLDIAKTQRTRDRLKAILRPQINDLKKEGQTIVEEHLKKLDIRPFDANLNLILEYFNYQKISKLYLDIARKKIDINEITKKTFQKKKQSLLSWLKKPFVSSNTSENAENEPIKIEKNKVLYITKKDVSSNLIKLAPCCNPIQGDEIIGYYEDKKCVVIHKMECVEAQRLKANFGNKILLVEWQKEEQLSYSTTLSIEGIDRQGLLRQIVKVISEDIQINIKNINLDAIDGIFRGLLTIYVHSNYEVERISQKLLKINSIKSVKRINS
jgi:GTP pyrophosphokinase